jgi:3-hydroxyacyl-[acyl-carrier-protein] dehydratase
VNPARIGVKYCGGCREQYNRKTAVYKIEEAFSEEQAVFDYANEGGWYDALLVVNGCPSRCADISGYHGRKIVLVVSDDECLRAQSELKEVLFKEELD